MARTWGLPDFRFVMMPHPIANLTPEQETAKTRLCSLTNWGGAYPFWTITGTGMNGPAMAVATSPATPLPPMPRMTTFSMVSCSGSPDRSVAVFMAASICSGRP